jgi:membrane protease subunit HflK
MNGPANDWEKAKDDIQRGLKYIGPIVIVLLVITGVRTSFYTVEPDEQAVIIRFGKYVGAAEPGLHFKVPFGVDSVTLVKIKRVLQEEFGFRTQSVRGERTSYSNTSYDDESLMVTGDLNVADVEWVVQYQISDPFKFLFQTSSPNRNIRDVSESIMRRVVGDRLVTDVLTTGRVEIANEAGILMQEVLDKYDMGVKIVTVKLQDVNPPDVVKKSFNEVNEAKQEQEKVINQAEEQYNKIIPEARGKAEQLVSEAEGYAKSLVNRAEGDAAQFEAQLVEYRRAPAITRKRLYLDAMSNVLKKVKDMTIVDPKIKGLLPIFKGATNAK